MCQLGSGGANGCIATRDVGALPPDTKVFLTGTGSIVTYRSTFQQVDHGREFEDVYEYEVTYQDVGNFFGGNTPSVTTVETTHAAHHGGTPDAPVTSSFETALQPAGGGTFRGTFTLSLPGEMGDMQTDLDHLAIAFSGGGKWDSDLGRNYDL